MKKPELLMLLAAALGAAAPHLAAQPAPALASVADTVNMERFEVSDVPIEQQILPTSRPFNSVFGMDDNIVDVPRSVTIISREQLTAIAIQDVRDFSKLTSSSYTRSNFGAPGNPDIRGQYADVFVNGMRERITSNGNGMPVDFNTVESVNIVKGPATAVQGVSAYVGGFVDFITKRPYFDATKGSSYFTVGSYDTYRWGIDYGGPLSSKLAYRVSYAGEDSEGYFYDAYAKKHSLYGALTYRPTQTYELFLNAYAAYAEYTENVGVNRPTKNLIENGLYRTGTNVNGGSSASVADPQNAANVTSGFPANVIAYGPEVPFDRRLRSLNPGDNSIARNFKVQAVQSFFTAPDLTIVNNNLLTYTRRETFSSYYYSEIIDPSWTLESRLEFRKRLHAHAINAGIAARYTNVKAYNDYFFEPMSVWDLTKDRNFINVYLSKNFPSFGQVFSGGPVPGWENRYGSSQLVNGDSNESYSYSGSPFFQATWNFGEHISVVTGARADFLHVFTKDPFTPSAEDKIDVVLPNANASFVYRVTPTFSTYATYNYSENTSGANGNGGGFGGLTLVNGEAVLQKPSFTQPSELFEVGAKTSTLNNRLFLAAALFQQTRQNKPQNSPVATYKYRGLELEANFQPSKRTYATFSYALIAGSVPADQIGFEALNSTPASAEIVPNSQTTGRVKVQGMPRNQWNAVFSYKFDNGFGFSLNGTLHDEINNNWAGTLVIPWQHEFDGSFFYLTKKTNYRLTILNLTDEENWSPPNGVYGNESITAEEGIRAEFTVTIKL